MDATSALQKTRRAAGFFACLKAAAQ